MAQRRDERNAYPARTVVSGRDLEHALERHVDELEQRRGLDISTRLGAAGMLAGAGKAPVGTLGSPLECAGTRLGDAGPVPKEEKQDPTFRGDRTPWSALEESRALGDGDDPGAAHPVRRFHPEPPGIAGGVTQLI